MYPAAVQIVECPIDIETSDERDDTLAFEANTADFLIQQTHQALAEGKTIRASQLFAEGRRAFPADRRFYQDAIATDLKTGSFSDISKLMADAAARFPDFLDWGMRFGWDLVSQNQMELARLLFSELSQLFPDKPNGRLGNSYILQRQGRTSDAEVVLCLAYQCFPRHAEVLHNYAVFLHHQRRWVEVDNVWKLVRELNPSNVEAYWLSSYALRKLGRLEDARDIISIGADLLPGEKLIALEKARISMALSEWKVANNLLSHLRQAYPDDLEISAELQATQLMLVGEQDGEDLRKRKHRAPFSKDWLAETEDPAYMQRLVTEFESLGGYLHGCEFGTVQRMFRAEPLGLLRWTEIGPEDLTAAIKAGFEGVGSPESTNLSIAGDGEEGEYVCRDATYRMVMHTFVDSKAIRREKMHAQMCKRLQFLKRKLLEDLRDGSKIFVYKTTHRILDLAEIYALHNAMQKFGENKLLYVRLRDEFHQDGDVELIAPNLMIGHIDKFANMLHGSEHLTFCKSWERLCRAAILLQ